jgi:hypothetical protein
MMPVFLRDFIKWKIFVDEAFGREAEAKCNLCALNRIAMRMSLLSASKANPTARRRESGKLQWSCSFNASAISR